MPDKPADPLDTWTVAIAFGIVIAMVLLVIKVVG